MMEHTLTVCPEMKTEIAMSFDVHPNQEAADAKRFLLWVDGVGGYLLCLSNRILIGGPADQNGETDVALLANLSRRHATITRSGDGYIFEPHGSSGIGKKEISNPTPLQNGYEIRLGQSVRLEFRLPSVLSGTAVLGFLSDHRPNYSVDGVIMMEDNFLLGSGSENHVICPDVTEPLVLFRRDGQIWCKCRTSVMIDGKLNEQGGPIQPGSVVTAMDLRFRLEDIPTQ
jgi:hypothetical protein